MICEFTLPSNPETVVRLREATVADAIDFSGIDPECEEAATSLFLDRVQERENYSNPREWTGEDRRYALFMYYIHTTTYKTIPLTYTCSVCGRQHTQDISLAGIANEYTPIKDQALREFPWQGHNVMVRPMIGSDLEDAEKYRYDLLLAERDFEARQGNLDASEYRRLQAVLRGKRVRMAMFRILCCIDMPYLDEKGTPRSRRGEVENVLTAMPASEFKDFARRVEEAIVDMRHGLRTSYMNGRIYLEIPDVRCDEQPEQPGILLHYPFRFGSVIPTL